MRILFTFFALSLASCGLSSKLLIPRSEWLVEPNALGYEFENFELSTGPSTSVHGWFLQNPASDGRTVVLAHGNAANISFYHPYYSMLYESGYHVVVFDYRGYGKSRGDLSVDALFTDTETVLASVFSHPSVDARKVILFGTSLGSIVALRSAARHPELAGLVVEDVASPHTFLSRSLGGFFATIAAVAILPSRLEPANNARLVQSPVLFICGDSDPALEQHLRAAESVPGAVATWVQPGTAHAPSGLLEHDGEYQAAMKRFLDACIEGRCPRIEVEDLGGGELELTRVDLSDATRLPVELCLVGASGRAEFTQHWLEGETLRVSVASGVDFASAWPYLNVEPAGESWVRKRGALARSADVLLNLRGIASLAREGGTPLPDARLFADQLELFESEGGALAFQAQTELIPELLFIGEILIESDVPQDRAAARVLLERCVRAEPPIHGAHYWPDSPYQVGFRFAEEVARARARLER